MRTACELPSLNSLVPAMDEASVNV
jgi:hypothetical protein